MSFGCRRPAALLLVFCFAVSPPLRCFAQQTQPTAADPFIARIYKNGHGQTMPYRLFVPPGYDANRKYPLVLWLHGGAGRGTNNVSQISGGNLLGTHLWIEPANQSTFPTFVLAPQCPENETWARPRGGRPPDALRLAIEVLDAVEKEFSIDPQRIYAAGQSMGGEGTWAALAAYRDLFAAAVPLCGSADLATAPRIANIPIWAFHGAADELVSVEDSRAMVAALRKAGGHPRYTEYPGVGHNVWEKAFAEPHLVPWLFAQSCAAKSHP